MPAYRTIARLLVIAIAFALAAPTATVRADPADAEARSRARAHFERGEKLFALSRFADALEAFEAAYTEVPNPRLLFNIAQCHRHLGNLDEAIHAYKSYLYQLPNAPDRKQVEGSIAKLERERDRRAAEQRGLVSTGPPGNTPTQRAADKPFYKKWWFIAGSVVVVGAATAVVVTRDSGLPDSDLGELDFRK